MILRRLKDWWALRKGLCGVDEDVHREAGFVNIHALDCYERPVGYCRIIWPARSKLFKLVDLKVEPAWRSQGIGTMLLRRALAIAGEEGGSCIAGSVVGRDLTNSPWLLEWYQRCGFTVLPPSAEDLPGTVNRIEKNFGISN